MQTIAVYMADPTLPISVLYLKTWFCWLSSLFQMLLWSFTPEDTCCLPVSIFPQMSTASLIPSFLVLTCTGCTCTISILYCVNECAFLQGGRYYSVYKGFHSPPFFPKFPPYLPL